MCHANCCISFDQKICECLNNGMFWMYNVGVFYENGNSPFLVIYYFCCHNETQKDWDWDSFCIFFFLFFSFAILWKKKPFFYSKSHHKS